jgi:transcriptional regulator with XRE-family HTH domain
MRNLIPRRVVELRKMYGLTQKELATKLDVKPSTVASWELNKRNPEKLKLYKEGGLKLLSTFDIDARKNNVIFYTIKSLMSNYLRHPFHLVDESP